MLVDRAYIIADGHAAAARERVSAIVAAAGALPQRGKHDTAGVVRQSHDAVAL